MKTLSRFHWWVERLFFKVLKGFPGGSDGLKKKKKKSSCNVRDLDLIPGSRRSPGGENSNPLQYSCLENPQRQSSLMGCSPWGHKDLDTTEQLSMHTHTHTHTHVLLDT